VIGSEVFEISFWLGSRKVREHIGHNCGVGRRVRKARLF
jgi:hypothetical protein